MFAVRRNCSQLARTVVGRSAHGFPVIERPSRSRCPPVAHPSRNMVHFLSQISAEKEHVLAWFITGHQRSWALRRLTFGTGRASTDISARFAQHESREVQTSSEVGACSGGSRDKGFASALAETSIRGVQAHSMLTQQPTKEVAGARLRSCAWSP
jgi:hypothetical protein